jgi:hypothetical protein
MGAANVHGAPEALASAVDPSPRDPKIAATVTTATARAATTSAVLISCSTTSEPLLR